MSIQFTAKKGGKFWVGMSSLNYMLEISGLEAQRKQVIFDTEVHSFSASEAREMGYGIRVACLKLGWKGSKYWHFAHWLIKSGGVKA